MNAIVQGLVRGAICMVPALALAQPADIGDEQVQILIRTTDRTPAQVVAAIQAHAEARQWASLGTATLKPKQGDVTLVKFCIPQVGALLWSVGLHLGAMLPCGNVGVYQRMGRTEITLLHPRYLHTLYPHPDVQKAVAVATPMMLQMLEEVTR